MAVLTCLVLALTGVGAVENSAPKVGIEAISKVVGKYEKAEFAIDLEKHYDNPFDPEEVLLDLMIKTPSGEKVVVPAFYCQNYERRKMGQGRGRANWYYPAGDGRWKARFAPTEKGVYSATARLKDNNGVGQSNTVRFECIGSENRGFLGAGGKDRRFFEFSDGEPFFVIGQNLAFIGSGQYVNLTKAEEIFRTFAGKGGNFLRIWTCCQDWALAVEARKSAWDRSWHRRNELVVPMPASESGSNQRKCILINGADGASVEVSPSHPVGLRPGQRYVLSGRFMAEGTNGLKVQLTSGSPPPVFAAAKKGSWQEFRHEFTAGGNSFWLGRLMLSLAGPGKVWIDNISLKEAGGGAELLWEADVNRSVRGYYNQLDCFILDKIIESAEQNGIYLMLCLLTRDLYMNSLSRVGSPEYQQAIDDACKFMRYAVARWGYSTSVAAWEYFNEMDPGKPVDKFYSEVGEYLDSIDIYNHLRTTSTWHPSAKDCRHDKIDIGQLHHYMRSGTDEEFKNEVAVLIEKTRFLREHAARKPALIGEFGLATEKWGLSDHMKQDSEGIHFHNSLWASAFVGGSGTAMFWWWDELDRQNAYDHYHPLARFLQGISFAGLASIKADVSADQVLILGYSDSEYAVFWLWDRRATWWSQVVEKNVPALLADIAVDLRGVKNGSYSVQWWDTRKGEVCREDRISAKAGRLLIAAPSFSRDIACRLRPAN
ncbi:MAG: DUF5060 domain-containing protein [Sedimentisphaerales bacterium]|nr:DUF5060 domain-containing protein [Sedimentisphaerales bacterium]